MLPTLLTLVRLLVDSNFTFLKRLQYNQSGNSRTDALLSNLHKIHMHMHCINILYNRLFAQSMFI